MTERMRNRTRRMGSDRTSSLVASAESPDAARRVVTGLMRRQGYLLACIHAVVMEDLIGRGLEAEAEHFNDEIKPMVDRQLGFSFEDKK